MKHCEPHYHLFSESNAEDQPGRWRFVLQPGNKGYAYGGNYTPEAFVAGGTEEDVRGERLELLCVVRGLEALDHPSRVTLITSSAYVREGIRYGLQQWRENDWQWESFGRMVPVKNRDLWQRVDLALRFHRLECRVWRFDPPHRHIERVKRAKRTIIGRNQTFSPSAGMWPLAKVSGAFSLLKWKVLRCIVIVRRRLSGEFGGLKENALFRKQTLVIE